MVYLSLDAEAPINPTMTYLQLTNFTTQEHFFSQNNLVETSFHHHDVNQKKYGRRTPNRIFPFGKNKSYMIAWMTSSRTSSSITFSRGVLGKATAKTSSILLA